MRIGQCLGKDLTDYGKGLRDIQSMVSIGAIDGTTQKLRKVDVFKKATMIDKEEFGEKYVSQCSSKQDLSLSAKIDKGPLSILEVMFEKASSLIQTDGLVIPKPGSSDGSYVVAGTCNRIFCVTPGKEDRLNVVVHALIAPQTFVNM